MSKYAVIKCLGVVFLFLGQNYSLWSQTNERLLEQVARAKQALEGYQSLGSGYDDEKAYIPDFNFTKVELEDVWYDSTKDSIDSWDAKEILMIRIDSALLDVFNNPEIVHHRFDSLFGEGANVVSSTDGKLNFLMYDENTGGTYRSRMFYWLYKKEDGKTISSLDTISRNYQEEDFFYSDGYYDIKQLETQEGTKYILLGYVRGCSYCFEEYLQLIQFEGDKLRSDFDISVNSRSWNDKIELSEDLQTIEMTYHTDDLTEECYCEDLPEGTMRRDHEINCICVFKFDGKTYH